jgi:hypothetical protein
VQVPENGVNWVIPDLFYDVCCVVCLEIFSVTELSKIFGLTAMSDSSNIPEPSVVAVSLRRFYCILCWLLFYQLWGLKPLGFEDGKWIEALQDHVYLWNFLSPVLILSSTIIRDLVYDSIPTWAVFHILIQYVVTLEECLHSEFQNTVDIKHFQ